MFLYEFLRLCLFPVYGLYAALNSLAVGLLRIKTAAAKESGEKCRTSYSREKPRQSSGSSNSRPNRKRRINARSRKRGRRNRPLPAYFSLLILFSRA
jgi:hypothetical protein